MFDFVKTFLAELRSLNNNLQKHSQAIAEANEATKEHESKTPEVRAILNFPESVQRSKEAADAREERYQNRNFLLGLATLIALVIYAITTIFIYCATNRAATATEKAAKAAGDAANEAKRSRIQAEASLNATIAQSQLDQRAWVGAKAMELSVFAADKPITGVALISNSGKTFALDTVIRVWIHPFTKRVNQLPKPMLKEVSPMVIFPNQETLIFVSTPEAPQEADIAAIRDKKIILYLYGKITYLDVFRKPHTTEFCGFFDGKKNFTACTFGNTAD